VIAGQSCNGQVDTRPRSYLLLSLGFSSRYPSGGRYRSLLSPDVQVRILLYRQAKCIQFSHLMGVRRQHMGRQPSTHTAASLFQNICYQNKDALSAGIIVAGWDKEDGPSVYNIPLGGGIFRQPWAIGGSGSTYVYGYCDATYQDGWGRDETVEFVKNSTCIKLNRRLIPLNIV
jgi:hypothetical protein